jgi:hypothetical protein
MWAMDIEINRGEERWLKHEEALLRECVLLMNG